MKSTLISKSLLSKFFTFMIPFPFMPVGYAIAATLASGEAAPQAQVAEQPKAVVGSPLEVTVVTFTEDEAPRLVGRSRKDEVRMPQVAFAIITEAGTSN